MHSQHESTIPVAKFVRSEYITHNMIFLLVVIKIRVYLHAVKVGWLKSNDSLIANIENRALLFIPLFRIAKKASFY